MATRKITDKQKDKLKNTQFARKNSADLTVNPNYEDDIKYDEDEGIDNWEDECEDEDIDETEDYDDDSELPDVCSRYSGWNIWVEKDDVHKFKITAVLENDDEYEIDRITIYGDEIDEDADVDTFVTDRIDEREDERAEARDWNENYASYMGLDEDPDWNESNDPDW